MNDDIGHDEEAAGCEPAQEPAPVINDVPPRKETGKPAGPDDSRIEKAQAWVGAFLIVVAGAVAYSNAVTIPFQYEDQMVIRDNVALHQPSSFMEALNVEHAVGPLAMASFALNWALSGGGPAAFHVVNIMLHLLNGVLVFLLCRRLLGKAGQGPAAILAGLIFVLHPAATESVDYIVGRAGLLALTFTLASVLLYLRATERRERIGSGALAMSVAALALALACDRSALAIPPLVLGIDWVLRGRDGVAGRLALHAAYWAVAIAVVVANAAANTANAASTAAVDGPSVVAATFRYLILTFSPGGLSVAYPVVGAPPNPLVWIAVPILVVLAVLAAALVIRRSLLGLAIAWYLIALAPALVAIVTDAEFAERRLYLPLVGVALVLPWLIANGIEDSRIRKAIAAITLAVAVVAGAGTFTRNRDWQDEETLWTAAAEVAPDAPFPQRRLGELYSKLGDTAMREAIRFAEQGESAGAADRREAARQYFALAGGHLQAALEHAPDDPTLLVKLGIAFENTDQPGPALDTFLDAFRLDSGDAECALHIASLLRARAVVENNQDDLVSAADYFARAQAVTGLAPAFAVQYCSTLLALGNPQAAEQALVRAGAERESSPLAQQLGEIRRLRTGVAALESQAVSLAEKDPRSLDALLMNARAMAADGRHLLAAYLFDGFLIRNPDSKEAWTSLGTLRARMGDAAGFIEEWGSRAPQPKEEENPWLDLARNCSSAGLWGQALRYLEADAAQSTGIDFPLLAMAGIASGLKQSSLAAQYLDEATKAYPAEAAPWLGLCDRAIGLKDFALARRLLAEAEQRNAGPADLEVRRQQIAAEPGEEKPEDLAPIVR